MDNEMELIENFHKKTEEQFLNKVRENNNDEIERMKQQINSLEKQIEKLESMEDGYLGYTTIKTFQLLGEMENIFQNKLDKCNKLYQR
jgi:TolA-binding protein